MMSEISYYQEYAQIAIEQYAEMDLARRYMLVDAVGDLKVEKVLDIGCGAGQEMLPFIEKKDAYCVGIDIGDELATVGNEVIKTFDCRDKLSFSRSKGEELPFADKSFDVVICRVALPYMHNKKTIAEVARVLNNGGAFILKTHTVWFLTDLLKERLLTLNPKQIAYPVFCLFNGTIHSLTGKQFSKGFWNGKQIFQTRRFLAKEFSKYDMKITQHLPDDNSKSHSMLIKKL